MRDAKTFAKEIAKYIKKEGSRVLDLELVGFYSENFPISPELAPTYLNAAEGSFSPPAPFGSYFVYVGYVEFQGGITVEEQELGPHANFTSFPFSAGFSMEKQEVGANYSRLSIFTDLTSTRRFTFFGYRLTCTNN